MEKNEAKLLMNKVRTILNEWDFIGVVDIGPQDEYDCMIGPIVTLLDQNASREEIKQYIQADIKNHFGLGENYSSTGLEEALDTLSLIKKV